MPNPAIEELSKLIRSAWENFPGIEPLPVKPELASVHSSFEDEDLYIKNEMFKCRGLRKIHLETAKLGKLEILHSVFWPDPNYNLPIFGVDLVAPTKDLITAAIVDITPVNGLDLPIFDDIAQVSSYYNFSGKRKLPAWGEMFSPYCKFTRLDSAKDISKFNEVVDQYLEIFVGSVWNEDEDLDGADERYDGQVDYCKEQKLNDKTRNILIKFFGKEWADTYMNEILFSEP